MKKPGQKQGLTLVELIVASMLIAIVLLGVVAFNLSLTQIQDDSFNQSTLSIQASTAMNYLKDDISMATGTRIKPGISIYSTSANSSLCLRQPDDTLLSLDDNSWICHIWDNTSKNLRRCVPTTRPTTLFPTTPPACRTTSPIMYLVRLQNGNFFQAGFPSSGLVTITLNAEDGTDSYSMTTDIEMKNHSR